MQWLLLLLIPSFGMVIRESLFLCEGQFHQFSARSCFYCTEVQICVEGCLWMRRSQKGILSQLFFFVPVIKLWSFSFKPPFSTLWTLQTIFLLCKLSYVFSSGNIGHDWETARLEEKEETYFLLNLCWFHIDFLFLWVPHFSPTNFYNLEAAGLFHCSIWMNYVILRTCTEPASPHLLPFPPVSSVSVHRPENNC